MKKVNKYGRVKKDAWGNVLNGKNTKYDPKNGRKIHSGFKIPLKDCEAMYSDQGIAKRCIDIPVQYMIKKPFTVEGDAANEIYNIYRANNFMEDVKLHLTWNRVFGGSLMIAGLDDGSKDFEKPLNLNKVKKINFFRVVSRDYIRVEEEDFDKNIVSVNYGNPEYYTIMDSYGNPEYKVHWTRCNKLSGMITTLSSKNKHQKIWGDSSYQSIFDFIGYTEDSFHDGSNIMNDFITTIISIENLQQMLTNVDGAKQIRDRANIMDETRSQINTVFLDAKEQYSKSASSVTGLPDLMREIFLGATAVTGIPVTLFLGVSPGGLNSTGETEEDFWYDNVMSWQLAELVPVLDFINSLIISSSEYKIKIKDPVITLAPLKEMSRKEKAETKKTLSEADLNNYRMNAISSEEVRSRFEGDNFSDDITLTAVSPASINNNESNQSSEESSSDPAQGASNDQ